MKNRSTPVSGAQAGPSSALRLLDWLWDEAEGLAVLADESPQRRVRALGLSGGKFTNHPFPWAAQRAELIEHALERREIKDIWFAPMLYPDWGPDEERGATQRKHGRALAGRAAWCDSDGTDEWTDAQWDEARAWVRKLRAAVVRSGTGDNFHTYVKLSRAAPPDVIDRINRQLIALLAGDKGKHDCSSLLRLPGTLNHKHDPPRPVVLESVPTDFEGWDPDELSAMLPDPVPARKKASGPPAEVRTYDGPGGGTPEGLALLDAACARLAAVEQDRNPAAFRTSAHVGNFVGSGHIDYDHARNQLMNALIDNSYVADKGEEAADKTIRYGLARGMENPIAPVRKRDAPPSVEAPGATANGKPYKIKLRDGAQLILDLIDAVNEGAVPDLYRSGGGLVHLFDVDDDPTMPVGQTRKGTREVTPTLLGALLARHVRVYETQTREGASGKEFEAEHRIQPELGTRQQVLAGGPWPGVPTLRGVTRIPVLRGDGTILNAPGYDPASGLYFDPQCDFSDLPTDPSRAQVTAARSFLLDALLRDFPFVSDADRANYLAALATPVVRRFLEGGGGVRPTPLLAVNAHAPGSGKTLLTEVIRKVFGGDLTQWKPDEAELGKCIVSALRDKQGAVYVLDNVEETQAVRSPTLSALLTSGVFTGRVLGQSRNLSLVNDLLWAVTGNNLRLEGDNASRSLLVGLDAGVERPDLRTGFKLGDLDTWLESSTNRGRVVRSLLVLARAWIVAGAPRIETPMRGFSWWASAMAGLLDFHGIGGFLGNTDRTGEADGARQEREAFLSAWFEQFGDRPMGVRELMGTYTSVGDQWGDAFILIDRSSNRELSTQVAGIRLRAMVDRPMGGLVLRSMKRGGPNSNTKKPKVYYVEPHKPGGRA